MMPIKSIIIDDDPFIRDLLRDKLEQQFPEVQIMDVAESGTGGMELIHQLKPELIFLDVEMKDMTGFEMLNQLEEINFQTIFITSYSHYAIKAIRFNALDYILKPIDIEELKQALTRYVENRTPDEGNDRMQQALRNINSEKPEDQILMLQMQDGELRLPLKDIVRIEGERNYSLIYLKTNRKKLASKTLGDFEELLSDKGFFRTHKSHLVNGLHISSYPDKTQITMSNEEVIPVSRRKKDEFAAWFEKYRQ